MARRVDVSIVLVGWTEFGEACLDTIASAGLAPACVLVPDGYPAEGMREAAERIGIPVDVVGRDLETLRRALADHQADVMVVASFPWLLPQEVLDAPRLAALNVHTAKLPAYRGYHPLNWAIVRDEPEIGITVHYLDAGVDSGDILEQAAIPVTDRDDVNTIRERLTPLAGPLLVRALERLAEAGARVPGIQQRASQATFAPRRGPEDGRIKWTNTSRDVFNLVRALASPYPNAFSLREDGPRVELQSTYLGEPGTVLAEVDGHYLVATGDGVVLIRTSEPLRIGERLL
jgi:methionyl-tRNA formyltransferase